MAKQTVSSELQRYALLGAQVRLQQLAEETADIYRTFPQLRSQDGFVQASTSANSETSTKRRRRRMSAAQRQAVGERMTKYWAAKRAAANDATPSKQSPSADTPPQAVSKRGRTATRIKASGKRGVRKLSSAARKRMSVAQKARWAKTKRATAS